MRIELTCAVCGNNRFALDGDIADEAHVECADCGHNIGTMGELKQLIAAEVMKRAVIRDTTPANGKPRRALPIRMRKARVPSQCPLCGLCG